MQKNLTFKPVLIWFFQNPFFPANERREKQKKKSEFEENGQSYPVF